MLDPFIEYLRTRNRDAFDRAVALYSGPIHRLLGRVLPDSAVEETAQDVLFKLSKLQKAAEELTAPRAFILRMTLHEARDRARADRVRARHEAEAGKLRRSTSPSASDEAILREQVSRILAAIDALPERLRIPIHLRAVEGLSYREIAEVLGTSVEAVGMRILRGRQQLRKSLGNTARLVWLVGLPWVGPSRGAHAMGSVSKGACGVSIVLGVGLLVAMASSFDAAVPEPGSVKGLTTGAGQESVHEEGMEWGPGGIVPRKPSWARRRVPRSSRGERVVVPSTKKTTNSDSPIVRTYRAGTGEPDMKLNAASVASLLVAWSASTGIHGVETRDVDGDGRLSLRDTVRYSLGDPPVPGSMDGFGSNPCSEWNTWIRFNVPALIHHEAVRRQSGRGGADWSRIWEDSPAQEPLAPDPRVVVEVLDTVEAGGSSDLVAIRIRLTADVDVKAFTLLIESESDVLRVLYREDEYMSWQGRGDWFQRGQMQNFAHDTGGVTLFAPITDFFASRGLYVINYNLYGERDPIRAGVHELRLEARLPQGLSAGSYDLRAHGASEFLLDDGALVAPTRLDASTTELAVMNAITGGWDDDGIPPIDARAGKIAGNIEFRISSHVGTPGDIVRPVIQMRTTTPLNHVSYFVDWPQGALLCWEAPTLLFRDPSIDGMYAPSRFYCANFGFLGTWAHEGTFKLGGYGTTESHSPEKLLDYFRPLGEWLDVAELSLEIPQTARDGDVIPLSFRKLEWQQYSTAVQPRAEFAPFFWDYPPCGVEYWDRDSENWSYDISYVDGYVRVTGDGGAVEERGEAGITMEIGTVAGAPGELVEVPVLASTRDPISRIVLALQSDPEVAVIEGVDFEVRSQRDDELIRVPVTRPGVKVWQECVQEPVPQCWFGTPFMILFHDGPSGHAVIEAYVSSSTGGVAPGPGYPPGELHEIARLLVRIAPSPARSTAPITIGKALHFGPSRDVQLEAESGGYEGVRLFAPVEAWSDGLVLVADPDAFVRGDANQDRTIDLSDAVSILNYLFLGNGTPTCLAAVDVNDDDAVVISDAIFLLGTLFLGVGAIPPPYPECGLDGNQGLSCPGPTSCP